MENLNEKAKKIKLVGTDKRTIIETTHLLLTNYVTYKKMSRPTNPYGDGFAAKKICKVLEKVKIPIITRKPL